MAAFQVVETEMDGLAALHRTTQLFLLAVVVDARRRALFTSMILSNSLKLLVDDFVVFPSLHFDGNCKGMCEHCAVFQRKIERLKEPSFSFQISMRAWSSGQYRKLPSYGK